MGDVRDRWLDGAAPHAAGAPAEPGVAPSILSRPGDGLCCIGIAGSLVGLGGIALLECGIGLVWSGVAVALVAVAALGLAALYSAMRDDAGNESIGAKPKPGEARAEG